MIKVGYKSLFIRRYKKLHPKLKTVVKEQIRKFQNPKNHKELEVHKLSGKMRGLYSFSVDYQYRIVFEYKRGKKEAMLLDIGDHGIYQ